MIIYEYPFNERTRNYLRLEHVSDRLMKLMDREDHLDHHFALATLFEIMDMSLRVDLKMDVLKDLEKQKQILNTYHGNPSISESVLASIISKIDLCFEALNTFQVKSNQVHPILIEHEWLASLKSRMSIPGGTSGFDLPIYFAWQQKPVNERRAQIEEWAKTFHPLLKSIELLLKMLRGSGITQKVAINNGQLQMPLPSQKAYRLLRISIPKGVNLIPETSGNHLLVSIRLLEQTEDYKIIQSKEDNHLNLTFCV